MVALHQGLIRRDSDPSFATCSTNVIIKCGIRKYGTGGAHVDKKTIIITIIIIIICKLQTD